MATKISDLENIHLIHEQGLDWNNNEIYVMGEEHYGSATGTDSMEDPGVEFSMAKRFIKNLNILSKKSEDPITIHLNSCGGDWVHGMAMFDAIKSCKNYITIIGYSEQRSMSSIIFLAADKRIIHKHGQFMFHSGETHCGGTGTQLETQLEEHRKAMEKMLDVYQNYLYGKPYWEGKTKKQIRNWLVKQMKEKEDVYLDSETALKMNFVDEIIESY